jgi:hypothetical protein
VQTKNALKTLSQKLIIKNIVQMNVAELRPIGALWKSIMKKKQLEMALSVDVKNVVLN